MAERLEPCHVHFVGKWLNIQKMRKEDAKEASGRKSVGNLSYHKSRNQDCLPCLSTACQRIGEKMDKKQLFIELENIQGRGITLYLEGKKSTPENVSDMLCIHEESSYMRDYVYDEGVLKELHFDKVQNL